MSLTLPLVSPPAPAVADLVQLAAKATPNRPRAWPPGSAQPHPTHSGGCPGGESVSFDAAPYVGVEHGGDHPAGTGRVLVRPVDRGVHRDHQSSSPAASASALTSVTSRSEVPSAAHRS